VEKENATDYATITIEDTEVQRIDGVALNHPYNLKRKISEKILNSHKKLRYTAYLNYHGNLCHVVDPNDPTFMIRIVFKKPIKNIDPMVQLMIIWDYLLTKRIVNIGPRPDPDTRVRYVWPNGSLDGKLR
jgi:hypothetical protein